MQLAVYKQAKKKPVFRQLFLAGIFLVAILLVTTVFIPLGNNAASPNRFNDQQFYNDFNLNFDRKLSPFSKLTGQLGGLLYNGSKYRSSYYGVVPERFNIKLENGDVRVPYRLEVGDLYPYLSFRTMQRSLKGVQLEFQPDFGGLAQHSILVFSAAGSPTWRSFQVQDDWSNGLSWLVNHPRYGQISTNVVLNNKQADPTTGLTARQQRVYSLAWEKKGVFYGERLTIEGEAGRFEGDHPSLIGTGTAKNKRGNGYFAQLSGQPMKLSALNYRMRYEAYDQDYQPNGASIQSNRRSAEGHLSWRFSSGLTARARWQGFRTNWRTNNPLDSIVSGINISGPLPILKGFSGSVDAFKQLAKSRDFTTNSITTVVNANVSKAITHSISARTGLYYANTQNKNDPVRGISLTRQINIGMDFQTSLFGFKGTFSPGFLARRVDPQGGKTNWEINPTININGRRDQHTISMSLASQDQGRPQNDLGVLTQTAGVNYRYNYKQIALGVESNWYARKPDNALQQRTGAWRAGFFLTYNFDKTIQQHVVKTASISEPKKNRPSFGNSSRFVLDMTQLKPGISKKNLLKTVAAAKLGSPSDQAGILIWFTRVLRDIDQNQRLAIETKYQRLTRTALIIEFEDVGNGFDAQRAFERVRKEIVESYGQPDRFYNQGNFGSNMAANLLAGRFIRVMEWNRSGGVLRFGIPRRVDGKVRMELQFGRGFSGLKDTMWSLEEVQ